MAIRDIEELLRNAGSLNEDELLDLAQRLIERARHTKKTTSRVDLNTLAGSIKLKEDPMAIQERMRREWE